MLTFESPTYALLFLAFPFLIYFLHFHASSGEKVSYSFAFWGKKTPFLQSSVSGRFLSALSYGLLWLAGGLIVVALMGPAYSEQKVAYMDKGIDVMFVLDESPTMGALDFGTLSRFDHAISILENFVRTVDNDSLGLITFATESVVRSPLTQDYDFFLSKLEDLYIMDLGDTTAIGNALGLALLNMTYAQAATKVIILMTDGILNAGTQDMDGLIEIAKRMGVRVYTMGIGTKDRVSVSFTTREGKSFRGTVSESYDDVMLKKIAEQTGGQYFSASSSYLLASAINKISSLEEAEKRIRLDVTHAPIVSIFMIWALIALVGYAVLRFVVLDAFL